MWIIHIFKFLPSYKYGLKPREQDGLIGILSSPFIHSDYQHLISNSVPFLILMTIIGFFYRKVAFPSFFIIYLLTGAAVWLFARDAFHIGASGVVYGLVSFVFWTGIFRRNIKSIVLALVVTVLYSGYLGGITPNQDGISWESHLFGGIVGIFAAFLLKNIREKDESEVQEPMEEAPEKYYLPRDTFDMTRAEREAQRRRDEEDFLKL